MLRYLRDRARREPQPWLADDYAHAADFIELVWRGRANAFELSFVLFYGMQFARYLREVQRPRELQQMCRELLLSMGYYVICEWRRARARAPVQQQLSFDFSTYGESRLREPDSDRSTNPAYDDALREREGNGYKPARSAQPKPLAKAAHA